MRYGKFLKPGDTIGFVAPSFGCATEPYRTAFINAQRKLKARGYRLELGPNCYGQGGIGISAAPSACGSELTDYYCSRNNNVLISCGGGELMCTVLDFVDFERIKEADPKWYMGYSDNTNFTYLLTTLCDTASVYGPCAPAFGMEPWHEAVEDAMLLLEGKKLVERGYGLWESELDQLKSAEKPLEPYNVTQPRVLRSNCSEASFRGRLLGGCMDCLINLLGTSYDKTAEFCEKYKQDGIIWFLESCELNPMSIRRAVWQMEHAGWFEYVKGFLIGRPCCIGQELMGLSHIDAVMGVLEKYGVPVIMDVDIGHLPPSMPVICGSMADITLDSQVLVISFDLS